MYHRIVHGLWLLVEVVRLKRVIVQGVELGRMTSQYAVS